MSFPQGGAHGEFVEAGGGHVPADGEELGLPGPPRRWAFPQDEGEVGQGLHVLHQGGPAPKPLLHGEGGLQPGLGPLPLHGLQKGGLLPADVKPPAPEDLHGWEKKPRLLQLPDGLLQALDGRLELLPHVEVDPGRPHGQGGQKGPLQDQKGVMLQEKAVLEVAGLGLVGVHHQVFGGLAPGHGPHLHVGGEGGPAPA